MLFRLCSPTRRYFAPKYGHERCSRQNLLSRKFSYSYQNLWFVSQPLRNEKSPDFAFGFACSTNARWSLALCDVTDGSDIFSTPS